jgi:hypothetical protein
MGTVVGLAGLTDMPRLAPQDAQVGAPGSVGTGAAAQSHLTRSAIALDHVAP